MLVAFTFRAKPGKERELQSALADAEQAQKMATLMGASRNTLFFGDGRMVRVLEFPEGVEPRSLAHLAKDHPDVAEFLRGLGPLVEDGFDLDTPGSLESFNKRASLPLVFDVRPHASPMRGEM